MKNAVFLTTLFLVGCNGDAPVDRADFDLLEQRVTNLETKLAEIGSLQSTETAVEPIELEVSPPEARMTFQLVGTAFGTEPTLQYRSQTDCESAQRALLDSWHADDEQKRSQGVVFTSRPVPTCVPL